MITVYPIGTTIYNPEKAFGGYTLLNFLHEPDITLFDMNGNVVNAWAVERDERPPRGWRLRLRPRAPETILRARELRGRESGTMPTCSRTAISWARGSMTGTTRPSGSRP